MANYWLKLYHETLHDPKMGRLPDRLYRRTIEIFLAAGENHKGGELPPINDLAWVLRLTEEELEADLVELSKSEIVHHDAEGDVWIVTSFIKRQEADSDAKRKEEQRKRDRQRAPNAEEIVTTCDGDVTEDDTICTTDIDTDTELEPELEQEQSRVESDVPPIPFEYLTIRQSWGELFPDKVLPRHGNKTLKRKASTRMEQAHFRENWREALIRASKSDFCNGGGWFTLGWFLANDNNYEKCLNGNYDNDARAGPATSDPLADYNDLVDAEGWDKEEQ